MSRKILIILTLLYMSPINAQSHNVRSGSWCKFIKNAPGSVRDESESARCLACDAIAKKEESAKELQRKKRDAIVAAKALADKKALELEQSKKNTELKEKNKVTEVKLAMPKTAETSNKNSTAKEYLNYKVVNAANLVTNSQFKAYNSKILYKDKVVFESNDLLNIESFDQMVLFRANYPRIDKSCKSTYSNNGSFLIDEKMKKVDLEGASEFYYAKKNDENSNYIDVTVVTGNCTPITDDRDKNAKWETKVYTFEFKTWKLIKSESSAYRTICGCNE